MAIPFAELARELPVRLGVDQAGLRAKVATLAALCRARWIALAGERLRSTARDYKQGITPVRWPGRTTAQIALVGVWPHALEHGKASWDRRETLLVMGKVKAGKRSKEGYLYLAVPFRHLLGGGDRRSMGQAYKPVLGDYVQTLRRQLAERARQLEATRTAPLGDVRTSWGDRLDTTDFKLPKLREHHTTDIYAGMVRQEKTYRKATQSQYTTWRMISDNPATIRSTVSGGNSWTHPGVPAARLLPDVKRYLAEEAPAVLGTGSHGGEG